MGVSTCKAEGKKRRRRRSFSAEARQKLSRLPFRSKGHRATANSPSSEQEDEGLGAQAAPRGPKVRLGWWETPAGQQATMQEGAPRQVAHEAIQDEEKERPGTQARA